LSGLGKGRIICWDNRRAPNKEVDLLNFYTTPVRSKNITSGYSRGNPDSRTVHRQQYYERLGGGALRRSRGRIQPSKIGVRVGRIRDYSSTRYHNRPVSEARLPLPRHLGSARVGQREQCEHKSHYRGPQQVLPGSPTRIFARQPAAYPTKAPKQAESAPRQAP
jgi:hypothetical protein